MKIYRKREIPGGYVTDDLPEITMTGKEIEFRRATTIMIDGKPLALDRFNYVYKISV